MLDRMELEMLVSLADPAGELLELMEGPSVHLMEFLDTQPVFLDMKVIEIPRRNRYVFRMRK